MKYCCSKCNDKGIYTEIKALGRFVSEDGRILCGSCSNGVKPADPDLLGRLEIAQTVKENLGFNILNDPEMVQDLQITTDPHELNYYFTYKNKRYIATYLKYLMEVELSILIQKSKKATAVTVTL